MPIRTESGLKLTYEDYAKIPADGRRHEILSPSTAFPGFTLDLSSVFRE